MLENWGKHQSMNTSPFMDKQIMDLSSSQNKNNAEKDFMDLNNQPSQEDNQHDVVVGDGDKKDEILPNYDFQPIRPIASSQPSNIESSSGGGARVWASADSKTNFGTRNYGSLESVEQPSKVIVEKDHRSVIDAALILEIDRTMKKHTDNLMHALEGVSARLSQLESRSRNLENSLDDLRTFVGNNHGNTDGKLRQIENIIREVKAGVDVVKDKQEILEAQLQLSQVQISKPEQPPEPQMGSLQQQQQAALPSPPPPNQQNLGLPIHHPPQFPANIMPIPQHDSYYPPPSQTSEPPPPQYQPLPPPPKLSPPSPSPPQPQYQYSQPPPPPMSLQHPNPNPNPNHPQSQPHSEEPPYLPYPPSFRLPGGGPPPQFHGNSSGPGFSGQYGGSPSGFNEPYGYGGSGSQYGGGSPVKSNVGPGGGSGFSQLPTARILPQAIPTAAAATSGGSGGGGNRVPIDDVVDKVTNMGFSREQVRATVRKLTENGQAVDLNVVLDKLMTDGVEMQGPRPWFGR